MRPARWVFAAGLLIAAVTASAAAPSRIVSLNVCTDQIVLDLVPRERIAAVSHLAADPLVSPVADQARGIPATRGDAESVLGLAPDLVVAGTYSTPATLALLERLGRPVLRVPTANDMAGIQAAIMMVAHAVHAPERGRQLLAQLETVLSEARREASLEPTAFRPAALVYQVNGLSAGPGTLADTLLSAAGFTNHAVMTGLGSGGEIALEALVAHPPALLVLSGPVDEYRTAVADNLRHPAVRRIMREHAVVTVPWRYWLCGTHHVATAIARLAEARNQLRPRDPAR